MSTNNENPVDLFEEQENLPLNVQEVIARYTDMLERGEDDGYILCKSFQSDIKKMGYTFEFGLDAVPSNLQKMDSPKNKWDSSPSP